MKQDEKQLQSNGIWDEWTANKHHQSSPKLARWLAKYLDMNTHVVDFGCGNGFYISELSGVGFRCLGIEGTNMKFLHDNVLVADLTSPLITYMVQQFTFMLGASCICLEVMEHVPKEYEQRLLDTITDSVNSKLILSWAEVNQPGIGHINCVDQSYAINEIEKRGFEFLKTNTQEARENIDDCCNWFRRTLLIFKRLEIREDYY